MWTTSDHNYSATTSTSTSTTNSGNPCSPRPQAHSPNQYKACNSTKAVSRNSWKTSCLINSQCPSASYLPRECARGICWASTPGSAMFTSMDPFTTSWVATNCPNSRFTSRALTSTGLYKVPMLRLLDFCSLRSQRENNLIRNKIQEVTLSIYCNCLPITSNQ